MENVLFFPIFVGNKDNYSITKSCSMNIDMLMAAQTDVLKQAFNADHILVYVMAFFLISVFVLLFYNRLYLRREHDSKMQAQSQNGRLALVLQSGNLQLWLYDATIRHYITLTEMGERDGEFDPVEYANLYNRDDFEAMRREVFDICDGRKEVASAKLRSNPKGKEAMRHYEVTLSIARRDKQGKVNLLLGVQRDVTDDVNRQQKVDQMLMRYHTVFSTSLVDMLYYDKDGILRDINDKASRSFHLPDREMLKKYQFRLEDNPFFSKGQVDDIDKMENTRSTSLVDFDDYKEEKYRTKELGLTGKMYYESTINPIRNDKGEVNGFYMAGRNVTEMVESYHRQKESSRQLAKVNEDIQTYISNINYALRVSDVRLVNYYPASYRLEISSNISEHQLRLSQLRCIRLATPQFRRTVSSVLNRMDHLTEYPIVETIETEIRDKKGRQIWLMFHMVPLKDCNGHVARYFGLCRNLTDMVETEQRLAVETKKAQETELLKQSFLTNMSYEIRTPLNTVVGFAELFESEHDVADEPVFVEEIKRNSNVLLQLVNDILFLSRLDANMLEYKKEGIDFALIFDGYCQMGWSSVNPKVKTIIENPYEHLVVNIDQEHLGMVIQKLCTLAVNYTHQGFIRAKYEYRHGELAVSIEDSGSGIDKETLPKVFDRFVRNQDNELCGTGLDLPIVQELVEQMGGSIEIQSEVGKGSTVWVTIPCEAKTIVKKREVVV